MDVATSAIKSLSIIKPVGLELATKGGSLYVDLRSTRPKIAFSDALTLAAARIIGVKVLTFDRDFDKLPDAIVLHQ